METVETSLFLSAPKTTAGPYSFLLLLLLLTVYTCCVFMATSGFLLVIVSAF